ncbi:MAG TPA: hypothetical protein VFK47_23995, partial [Ktedonobacteraceae bacterium]|nr:hypothetical protein [Ktedonobacteraceae bacterium]
MKRPELADEVTRKLELVTLSDPGSYSLKLADEVTREMKSQPGSHAKNIRSQVMRYEAWLSMQTRRSTLASTLHEMNEYAESAGKTALVRNRKVRIFAPFRTEHSALWVVTRWQCVVLLALMLAWCGGLAFFPRQMLLATLTFITALYFGHFMMTLGLSCLTLQRSTEEEIDEQIVSALQTADWPYYTILCPLYKEARVVPQFVRAMQA